MRTQASRVTPDRSINCVKSNDQTWLHAEGYCNAKGRFPIIAARYRPLAWPVRQVKTLFCRGRGYPGREYAVWSVPQGTLVAMSVQTWRSGPKFCWFVALDRDMTRTAGAGEACSRRYVTGLVSWRLPNCPLHCRTLLDSFPRQKNEKRDVTSFLPLPGGRCFSPRGPS